jgi:hypothetical protein
MLPVLGVLQGADHILQGSVVVLMHCCMVGLAGEIDRHLIDASTQRI